MNRGWEKREGNEQGRDWKGKERKEQGTDWKGKLFFTMANFEDCHTKSKRQVMDRYTVTTILYLHNHEMQNYSPNLIKFCAKREIFWKKKPAIIKKLNN